MHDEPLHPTNGHIIAGTMIDAHRFVGRVKAAQLFQIAPDPRDTENKKKVDSSKELQDLHSVREEVQRLFEGAKKKNVPSYADYIVALASGQEGIAPPITLYSENNLAYQERADGTAFIQISWEDRLVAIDGETQLAARHEAQNIDPATKQEFVPVYICFGLDKQWARQAFHDLNALGVKPNAAISLGMDARDPITKVSREVERQIPFFTNRVNKVRRQLRATDADVVTLPALRGACVTLAQGINGVKWGSRPVPLEEAALPAIEAAAIDWFGAIAEALGPQMQDRERTLISSPSVLAAIGAIGFQLVSITDVAARKKLAYQLANQLRAVDWDRSDKWAGIAGKTTPKGALSVGGAKETAYAVYAALADSSSESYARIRKPVQLVA